MINKFSFSFIHWLSRNCHASPPCNDVSASSPSDWPFHLVQPILIPSSARRGLVESPRGGEGTTELTGSSARLQSRQGEDGAAHRSRGLQHLVSHWLLQGEQRSQAESGLAYWREREREMKVLSSLRPLTVESVSVRSVGRMCVRRDDRYIRIFIPLKRAFMSIIAENNNKSVWITPWGREAEVLRENFLFSKAKLKALAFSGNASCETTQS